MIKSWLEFDSISLRQIDSISLRQICSSLVLKVSNNCFPGYNDIFFVIVALQLTRMDELNNVNSLYKAMIFFCFYISLYILTY